MKSRLTAFIDKYSIVNAGKFRFQRCDLKNKQIMFDLLKNILQLSVFLSRFPSFRHDKYKYSFK